MIVWMKVLNFTKIKVEECEDLIEKIWTEGRIFGEDGPMAIFILGRIREIVVIFCVCVCVIDFFGLSCVL